MRASGRCGGGLCGVVLVVGLGFARARAAVALESPPEPAPATDPEPPPAPARARPRWWQTRRPAAPPGEHLDPDSVDRARAATVTSWALGIWGGAGWLTEESGDRAGTGSVGFTVGLSLAITLRDHIPLAVAFSGLILRDRAPFTERVVQCTSGLCGEPFDADSHTEASLLSLEAGYQHRFWSSYWTSLTPAFLVGYAWNPGGMSRGVNCDGCKSVDIDGVHVGGLYLGPSFKLTSLTGNVTFGLALRSEFFLTGAIVNRTLLGFEIGTE